MRRILAAAVLATLGFAGAAKADFYNGQPIGVEGWGDFIFGGGTSWGGGHDIGGVSIFPDDNFPTFSMTLVSAILGPGHLSLMLDFANFAPSDFATLTMEFYSLKSDGSIIGVQASKGVVTTDGNNVFWSLSPGSAADEPIKIDVFQIPAPGAIALLGVAGIAVRRRRA